jgi:long-chain acyl-CoA synthetase
MPAAAVPRFTTAITAAVPDLPWVTDRTTANPDDPAVYMFSSGSTGKSKRVTRTVGQIVREYEALAATVGLTSSEVILCTVPLYHAHGFGNAFMAALLSGGRLVLLTQEFNARAVLRALEAQQVTMYPAVPFMYKMLSDTRISRPPNLASLRLLISAGAPLPQEVAERFHRVYGKPISQLYGSTETGAICLNLQASADKPTAVGRPLAGLHVSIRGERGETLGTKDVGEIWIQSPAMTMQYDGLPEQTAQAFAEDRFFAGDLGYLDEDGDLFITGRKKLLVNVAGNKVDPLEVERVVLQHPAIADAVVIGVEHAGYGELLKAVVVARDGHPVTAPEIMAHAMSRLAEYKVPREVEFRSEIPRSPLGKVLRKYL